MAQNFREFRDFYIKRENFILEIFLHVVKMAMYKYFKKVNEDSTSEMLPSPDGPLSVHVPSSSIAQANKEVKPLLQPSTTKDTKRRGHYYVFTETEKAEIAKRAAEFGVTSTVRHFNKKFTDRELKESTVRTWANRYKEELATRKKKGEDMAVAKLVSKKRGRPLTLGEGLDKQVQKYVAELRENGCPINTAIVMATAEGIVKSHDSNLLQCNGGHIDVNKHWAKNFLTRLGYVKRRANTKSKVDVESFESYKAQFLFDIQTITEMEEIPKDLIINWDHTGLNYVPVSNWTMAEEGSKRVEIVGIDDKRQITAVFGCTLKGDFLPPQIIYAGKTQRCLPTVKFPSNWHITYTQNHWANEETTHDYIKNILIPYVQQRRCDLSLDPQQPALVIFDRFKGQCTPDVLALLDKNNVHFVIVPANCTDRLQPLDVSVNKAAKEFLRRKFQQWYSDQVYTQIKNGTSEKAAVNVDLKLSIIKPLGAQWLIDLYDYFKSNTDIIQNGFKGAGIIL